MQFNARLDGKRHAGDATGLNWPSRNGERARRAFEDPGERSVQRWRKGQDGLGTSFRSGQHRTLLPLTCGFTCRRSPPARLRRRPLQRLVLLRRVSAGADAPITFPSTIIGIPP